MSASWYGGSKYQREITHKAANIYENYTNEPFALRLNIDGLGDAARADGADIVFTDANGALLKRAIISFDRTTPDGQAWVQLPSGDATAGGTAIYMQWGGLTVNVANDADVFPTEYDLVTLIDGTGDDYSQNANDGSLEGTSGSPSGVAGQVGNGLDFDDSDNQHVDYGDQDYYSFPGEAFTVIAWANNDDVTNTHVVTKWEDAQRELLFNPLSSNSPGMRCYDNTKDRIGREDAGGQGTGSWRLVVGTKGTTELCSAIAIYYDGVQVDDGDSCGPYDQMRNTTSPLQIGGSSDLGQYFDGKLNAVRLYSGEWSENKIKTVYDAENNYSTNGAFTVGDKETVPPDDVSLTSDINRRSFEQAIFNKIYSSRSLSPLNSLNRHNCIITRDGTLYAVLWREYHRWIVLKSTDNGFTWSISKHIATNADSDHNPGGNNISIFYSEAIEDWFTVHSFSDGSSESFIFYRNDTVSFEKVYDEYQFWMDGNPKYTDLPTSGVAAIDGDADRRVYTAYIEESNDYLTIAGWDMLYGGSSKMSEWSEAPETSGALPRLSMCCKDDKCNIAYVTNDDIKYVNYTKKFVYGGAKETAGESWSSPVSVDSTYITDPAIELDGDDNICIGYGKIDASGINPYYAYSTDSGSSFTTVALDFPLDCSGFVDSAADEINSSKEKCRTDLIGNADGGFMLSMIFALNGSGVACTKELTPAGSGFSESAWKPICSVDYDEIYNGTFFHYDGEIIPEFNNKLSLKYAYQVGTGESMDGLGDRLITPVFNESLTNNAFPITYSGAVLIGDDLDYYASGYIGDYTNMYLSQFDEIGTSLDFQKYNPLERSNITGKGAYQNPESYTYKVLVDPSTYEFPAVALNNSDQKEYIERDVRKIFISPENYLDRDFILNKGGFLKRTIWTVRVMDNDYEVAQIVPRIINNQLVYYEANLYVIGPSNDPFKRTILPSET